MTPMEYQAVFYDSWSQPTIPTTLLRNLAAAPSRFLAVSDMPTIWPADYVQVLRVLGRGWWSKYTAPRTGVL